MENNLMPLIVAPPFCATDRAHTAALVQLMLLLPLDSRPRLVRVSLLA